MRIHIAIVFVQLTHQDIFVGVEMPDSCELLTWLPELVEEEQSVLVLQFADVTHV